MKFNQEQQAFIDDLIQRTYTRAYQKAETGAARTTELEVRTIALEEQLKKSWEGLRDAELKGAAAKHGACHPPDVAFLLRDAVKIAEDGEMTVVAEDGKQRFDKAGSPLTIDGAVGDWLSKNGHFCKVKAAPASGAGGGGLFAGLFK